MHQCSAAASVARLPVTMPAVFSTQQSGLRCRLPINWPTVVNMHSLQILQLLQRLANTLGQGSAAMTPLTLPLLDYALDPHGPEALNLLEDAIILWLVVLRNAPDGHTDLLRLWPRWRAIMASTLEHVPVCMLVATSAALLGGNDFVQVLRLSFGFWPSCMLLNCGSLTSHRLACVIQSCKGAACFKCWNSCLHTFCRPDE